MPATITPASPTSTGLTKPNSAIDPGALCENEFTLLEKKMHATRLTDRFDKALLYATHVHGGQARKGTPIPYIAHLLAVSATVLEYDGCEDMAIAGLLHDAVEDQGGEPRLADIRNRFGDRVADIVRSCSDTVANTSAGQQKEDWNTRKKRYVEHLSLVDEDTLLVSLSDKIHNARSILRDLRKPEVGKTVWLQKLQYRHALVLSRACHNIPTPAQRSVGPAATSQ